MQENSTIYIIGSGVIGKALAVCLTEARRTVRLVRGSVDNEPEIRERIVFRNAKSEERKAELVVTTFSNLPEINGVVVITSKAFGNGTIARKLAEVGGAFPLIILQNGLNIKSGL